MRNRLRLLLPLLAVIGICVAGLTRLRLETNVLEILPKDLPSVEALKVSQKYFANDQQVVLVLKSEKDEIEEADAAEFTKLLREKLPTSKVLYKSEIEEDPTTSARALAELWRYAPPAEVANLEKRLLDPAALISRLEEVKGQVGRSFDQQKATMAAYDPLGFLEHPAVRQFMDSEFSFQSEDGRSQIILITNPHPGNGYQEQAAWIQDIRTAATGWPGMKELGLSFSLTGGPVFNAEIGGGMEKDMSGTAILPAILIGAAFLLVQRHLGQLLLTFAILGLTFLITLGVGGWIYGTLNLVSVGFSAILLGLAVDYLVVIARESIGCVPSSRLIRREVTPGIFWASITTIIVFGGLGISSFTGVRQMGGLIFIGLTASAAVTLILIPIFLERFPCKEPRHLLKAPFPNIRIAGIIVGLCLLASFASFVFKGSPRVSFDFSMVEPTSSEAAATFESIKADFPAWSEKNFQIIASARSWDELKTVAEAAGRNLTKAKDAGLLDHFQWPVGLIPDNAARDANRAALEKIAAARNQILETVKANGFSESGLALDTMVLESLAGPGNPADIRGIAEHFLTQSDKGDYYLAGMVKTRDEVTPANFAVLGPLLNEHSTVTGWPILKAALLPLVKRDFYWIFLPTAALLFVSLLAVFRTWKDAAISAVVLLTSLALLNAFLVIKGQPWNFLSGIAIPMIFGLGVDYTIHLVFALRRFDGDWNKVWNTAGKAICLCGFSNAIGFSSLLGASNGMLRSMGLTCGMAVLLTTFLSLIVVPALWKWSHRPRA